EERRRKRCPPFRTTIRIVGGHGAKRALLTLHVTRQIPSLSIIRKSLLRIVIASRAEVEEPSETSTRSTFSGSGMPDHCRDGPPFCPDLMAHFARPCPPQGQPCSS